MNRKKVVLILSGGMDSTTLAYYLVNGLGWEVKALSFDYGQRHSKELEYAIKTCKSLKIEHKIVPLEFMKFLASNSSLTSDMAVPEGHYEAENMKLTVVPGRNTVMLSIAMAWAENLKYDFVSYANHKGDHHIYNDCRVEYVKALEKAFDLASGVKIYTPFEELSKNEIAKLGFVFKIDYDKQTWTCYKGEMFACGVCGACQERKEALEYANQTTS